LWSVDLMLKGQDLVPEREDLCVSGVAGGEYPSESVDNKANQRRKQGHERRRLLASLMPETRGITARMNIRHAQGRLGRGVLTGGMDFSGRCELHPLLRARIALLQQWGSSAIYGPTLGSFSALTALRPRVLDIHAARGHALPANLGERRRFRPVTIVWRCDPVKLSHLH